MWSYSRLQTFEQCPYAYYRQYILKDNNTLDNTLAEYGTFMHSLLEGFFSGKLTNEDMVFKFQAEYDDNIHGGIKIYFAPNKYKDYSESYYSKAIDYLAKVKKPDGYEVVDTEKLFTTNIGDMQFRGIIDLIIKNDDGYTIVDHKSSNSFAKKELKEKQRQLYLYAKYIHDTYNVYPKELWFNHFKGGKIDKIPFSQEDYEEAQQWALDTKAKIDNCETWQKVEKKGMFCWTLCGFREQCWWE